MALPHFAQKRPSTGDPHVAQNGIKHSLSTESKYSMPGCRLVLNWGSRSQAHGFDRRKLNLSILVREPQGRGRWIRNMPQIFAIVICVMLIFGLAGLVKLEYKRARKGPRLKNTAFFNGDEDPKRKGSKPAPGRNITHEIGY
jgi:hypothetical protein